MRPFYPIFRNLFRGTLQLYYKKISVEGFEKVPRDCPVLVTCNHQNAFVDALLAGGFIPVQIFSLTRSDVFTWWNRPIMWALNMMPIYRIRDGYSSLSQNEAVFKTCADIFSRKRAILIFAEGNHGEDHYLRPLTKGAARLAIQSQMQIEQDLKIVPVGLNYFNHTRPGSKVLISFGDPISVRDYVGSFEENSGKGLIKMRDAIADGMKATLAIPEKTEDYEDRKATVFRKENESLTLQELRSLPTKKGLPAEKKSNYLVAKILNPLPFLLIKKVLSGVKDIVFFTSLKYGIGLVAFPIWWLSSYFTINAFFGVIPAAVSVGVMITALFISNR